MPITLVDLDPIQITFIIVVPIIVIFIVFILLYKPIMRKIYRKKFKDLYGKKIYKIALYEDFYLINDFIFSYEDTKNAKIDHVLFGDKFIYLINDYYYNGSLVGNVDNQSLILVSPNNTKSYADNPLNDSKLILKRLSLITNIDSSLMIGISLVNDECAIDIEQTSKQFYLIQASNLSKLIKAIESRPIQQINADQLQIVVKELDKFNRRGKRRAKKSS